MKRILDYGGKATCTQLAIKYGESKNFYNSGSSALARRIVNKTNCPIMSRDNDESKWWPVLYVGKAAKKDEEGSYVWKLRDELAEALGRVDLSKVNLYANLEPNFWKISHGNDCISDVEAAAFEKRQVIVVHKDTAAKGKSKVSQGEDFMATMKKGDFFYLCRGNSIRLLGRIDSDEVNENPEKQDGWYERSYTVITESRDTSAYSGNKKWWTPNENSTCIVVPKSETQLFEDYILKPYFDITKEELLKNDTSGLRYWFLNANPKIWSMSSMPIGEVQDYTLYNDNGNKRRIFQNFLDAKAGDMVIGYESTPVKQIVASFVDEQRMCRLYEKFILEYYSKHFPELSVSASQIPWSVDDGIRTMLPVMQSDIHLQKGNTVLIIDAKYYSHTTQTQYDKHTLHSNNMYQIFTYVKNRDYEFGDEDHKVSGMLLYAKMEEEIQPDNVYQMHGNQITVRTLDLNLPFPDIAKQLNTIAETHFDLPERSKG